MTLSLKAQGAELSLSVESPLSPLVSSSLCLGTYRPSETAQSPQVAPSELIAGPKLLNVQEEGHVRLL